MQSWLFHRPDLLHMLHPFLVSTGVVALAEIGDKTQLLALLLTAQFRRPIPIIAGIFVATVINHLGAGALGTWLIQWLGTDVLRWVLGLSFLAMAAWTLIPDKLDDATPTRSQYGVFVATVLAFFLAEMGDKTQIATVALAARYQSLVWVVLGSTAGMLIANVPAVLFGDWIVKRVPVRIIRVIAAAVFAALGLLSLLNIGNLL